MKKFLFTILYTLFFISLIWLPISLKENWRYDN